MPARKKAAKKAKRRVASRPRRAKGMESVAVGDAVQVPGGVRNRIVRYDPRAVAEGSGGEGIEGVVCSIREIASGKLVAKTTGDVSRYVLEIVHTQTFRPHFASDRNTGGPRGPEDVRNSPGWRQLRAALCEMAARKQLVSMGGAEASDALGPLLDGWRVIKVRAERLDTME